ncbi:hypothetical protein Bbelb_285640 [Branchiostoma belcheri]|nr:hypothetical protein Bbelb_285640 [Branchiostoma belcheri]
MASPSNPSMIVNSVGEDTSQPVTHDDGAAPADPSNNVDNRQPEIQEDSTDETCSCCNWKFVLKWVLAIVIAVAVLLFMVFSTIFTFALAKDLKNETRAFHGVDVPNPKADADFVALWLILFLPFAFGFTRALIKESLSSGQPWPIWKSGVFIPFVSLAEVFGLWIFTFYVLPDVDITTAIIQMSVVLHWQMIPQPKGNKQESSEPDGSGNGNQMDIRTAHAVSFLAPLSLAPVVTLLFADLIDLCPLFGNDMWCRNGALTDVEIMEHAFVILVATGQMFWFPQHTGIFTGQHMMLNRTKHYPTKSRPASEPSPTDHKRKELNGTVMICTTMYRETWDEMSKYLESIKKVAESTKLAKENDWAGNFEAHVYFDNGVIENRLTDFSAQLACLVYEKFKDVGDRTTEKTWYGWKLHWSLPGSLELPLHIHLKDTYNQKVKSKKRWSQVMYMDSAVNSMNSGANDPVKYILATDGDVDFDADSIAAMLLQMLSDREEQVGAVCARTHPEGSGPFVWYQMFDYAIGHWLQKVANHVLGSVLCAPGCFSVYRVKAIADVLEEYRSDVEAASDFLTKDMGEDRWFTTLLVKAGYKINYCAGACDSTHCPEEFDEFWKQRRRWIPSTLANQILLLNNWKDINKNNKHISMVFLLFQVILLFATIISPSTCILIMAGGLYYGLGVPPWLSLVLFILLTLIFAVICMSYSQDTQLKAAKILCFIFLVAMAIAVVGTASQMVLTNTSHLPAIDRVHGTYEGCYLEYITPDDPLLPHAVTSIKYLTNGKCMDHCYHKHFDYSGTSHPTMCFCGSDDDMKNGTKLHDDMCAFPCPGDSAEFCGGRTNPGQITIYNINDWIWIKLPLDVSTLYIAIVAGIHVVAALLHLEEFTCIIYGVVYLFTLPCVYILMNVYSLCNLTDQSWGTREAKSQQEQGNDKLSEDIMSKLRQFFTQCCQRSNENAGEEGKGDNTEAAPGNATENKNASEGSETLPIEGVDGGDNADAGNATANYRLPTTVGSQDAIKESSPISSRPSTIPFLGSGWEQGLGKALDPESLTGASVEIYERKFVREGYTDTSFIAGMTEKDLRDIGVNNLQDRNEFRRHIKKLTEDEPDIEITVPDNVDTWLQRIGLQRYSRHFDEAFPKPPPKETHQAQEDQEKKYVKEVFKELKVMPEDVIKNKLKITAKGESKIIDRKKEIERMFKGPSKPDNVNRPRQGPGDLDPTTELFRNDKETDFKGNLQKLRNKYLAMISVVNVLWLVLMFTLAPFAQLQVLNTNPLGLVFLVTFVLVLGIQFAALFFHRAATFIQWMSSISMFSNCQCCHRSSQSDGENLPLL